MIRFFKYFLLVISLGFISAKEKPSKINITGRVLDKSDSGIKGAKLIIENDEGEIFKNAKDLAKHLKIKHSILQKRIRENWPEDKWGEKE